MMKMKLVIYLLGVVLLSSCAGGMKYCENQKYDFLDAEFKPCNADKATYRQNIIRVQSDPMHHKGKLIASANCGVNGQDNNNLTVPDGRYDDFETGTRRIYENGKLLFEILPVKREKGHVLVFHDYTNVSDESPYYRSWFYDDFSGKVTRMRINYLGLAKGYYEDFVAGMLDFDNYPSYAGGQKRIVRIAFDHEKELTLYLSLHGGENDTWLSEERADLKKKKDKRDNRKVKRANRANKRKN